MATAGGEPVTVTQYGRPTLLIMRYQDGMEALRIGVGPWETMQRVLDVLAEVS